MCRVIWEKSSRRAVGGFPRSFPVRKWERFPGGLQERYPWSSYRNYVGGPKRVPWVETREVLGEFGGKRDRYRAYVEAGKGERQVSPFERAVAGLALGSEEFLGRVRKWVSRMRDRGDQPALRELAREGKARPEQIEAEVREVFADVGPARRGRLLLYAFRKHSGLGATEIGRRYGRTHTASRMAVRCIEAESRRDPGLSARLKALAKRLE